MKYYITCLFLLTACARFESSPENCKVNKTSNGVVITCPDGSSSTVSNGTNGSNGAQGIQGATGDTGATGLQGDVGPQGIAGTNGLNGSTITMVTFCTGSTSYPSEFNEIGFCIDNNIYAVYSANDGFLSYIPPGAYSSNGINSSCTFTVSANCVITH